MTKVEKRTCATCQHFRRASVESGECRAPGRGEREWYTQKSSDATECEHYAACLTCGDCSHFARVLGVSNWGTCVARTGYKVHRCVTDDARDCRSFTCAVKDKGAQPNARGVVKAVLAALRSPRTRTALVCQLVLKAVVVVVVVALVTTAVREAEPSFFALGLVGAVAGLVGVAYFSVLRLLLCLASERRSFRWVAELGGFGSLAAKTNDGAVTAFWLLVIGLLALFSSRWPYGAYTILWSVLVCWLFILWRQASARVQRILKSEVEKFASETLRQVGEKVGV